MQKKTKKTFFYFEITPFELIALTLAFTEREYLSSGINMLTSSLKISDTTETEYSELISFQSDQ